MRSFRSLLIWVALLGGLLAYLYFVDAKKPVEQAEEKAKVFARLDSDKIDELKVSTVAGGVASLQKGADGWRLTEPTAAKADESEVSGITSNLSSLTVERVVDEAPANLGDYGLKEPVIEARPSVMTACDLGAVMTTLSRTTANWSSGGWFCRL